jgi:hypothetical protein
MHRSDNKKKALSSLSVDDLECDTQQLLDRSAPPTIDRPMPAKGQLKVVG